MAMHVNIPCTIRVDSPARLDHPARLASSLAQGLGRALADAQSQLAEVITAGAVPLTHMPSLTWSGSGLAQTSEEQRQNLAESVRQVVNAVIDQQRLPAANQSAFATSADEHRRAWRVVRRFSARMKVSDYVAYWEHLDPGTDYRTFFLDILHEERYLVAWLVELRALMHNIDLAHGVVERIDELSPLAAGETSLWTWTAYDRDVAVLQRHDRHHNFDAVPPLAQHNRGRIIGTERTAVFLPGARVLVTRMKMPELPSLQIAHGQEEAFWAGLRLALFGEDAGNRQDAAELLVSLRVYAEALAIIEEALAAGYNLNNLSDINARYAILGQLRDFPGRPYSIALLLLKAVDHPMDTTAHAIFKDWFKQDGGRDCLNFLERALTEESPALQVLAARVLLYLRDWARTDEAQRYRPNVALLQRLVRRLDIFSGGVLGEESLRHLLASQCEILAGQIRELDQRLVDSPYQDPYRSADRALLSDFDQSIDVYLLGLTDLGMAELEAERNRLATMLLASEEALVNVAAIHQGIGQIRDVLGSVNSPSDEVDVLFELRHRYVQVLAEGLFVPDFSANWRDVLLADARFSETVAEVKWRRARSDFFTAVADYHDHSAIHNASFAGPVQSPAFYDLRDALSTRKRYLRSEFEGLNEVQAGGRSVVLRVDGNADIPPVTDVRRAAQLEAEVALFRIHTAMYVNMAISLLLANQIAVHEIGTESFRTRQLQRLQAIREDIVLAYNNDDYQSFIDQQPEVERTFSDIQREVRQAVREAVALELLITAVAALLSMGVGLIARAALVGRTVGVLRSASAVNSLVLLTESGVFTATQLTGQRVVFGRDISGTDVAEAALRDLAFLGGMSVLGRLTAPLLSRGGWGFVAAHSINASTLAAVTAGVQRIQTGEWPSDIRLFLVQAMGGYVLVAGVAVAGRNFLLQQTRLGAVIESRIEAGSQRLSESNRRLLAELEVAYSERTLSQAQFRSIKQGLRDNIAQARELARQLHHAGLRTADDLAHFEASMNRLDDMMQSFAFDPPPGWARGGRVIALPPPNEIPGVTRVGDSNLYHYRSGRDVNSQLTRYRELGFGVEHLDGGIIQITHPNGHLLYVLDPSPLALPEPPSFPMLTAGTDPLPSMTLLERSLGRGPLAAAPLADEVSRIEVIHPRLLSVLEAEFADATALAALRLFNYTPATPWERWPIDSVRGVAEMVKPERGILLRPIFRLFESRSQSELKTLFQNFNACKDMPGVNRLVSEELRPGTSLELINVYNDIRRARLNLPNPMSRQAISGIIHWLGQGRDVAAELRAIPVGDRLERLEATSPIRDPRLVPAGTREEQLLQAQNAPIRPGLDLLNPAPADVVAAIEAYGQTHGGSLGDAVARSELVRLVTSYQAAVRSFQAGGNVERNMLGGRGEIDLIIATLESGASVLTLGNTARSGNGRFALEIDPSLFPLPNGVTLINVPDRVPVQLDTLAHTVSGALQLVETTTGDLSLPRELAGLDPSGTTGGTADWSALSDSNASHRKWKQIIKLRAVALFGQALAANPHGVPVTAPELVIRVGRATAPARRAAEAMGFRVIETNP